MAGLAKTYDALGRLSGWRSMLVAFLAGALMTLGFAPFHIWPVIFIALPIFYQLMATSVSLKQGLIRSFFFGYGYSMAGTWWIANALLVDAGKFAWMMPFSILGLSAAMAMWFVFFGWWIYGVRTKLTPLLFAAVWVMTEYWRSVGSFGLPWNLVGYMGLASLPFAQGASVVGVYGLGFLIVLLGVLPIVFLQGWARRRVLVYGVPTFVVVLAMVLFGYQRLQAPTVDTDVRMRVVQPNVPQEVKGTREGRDLATQLLGGLTAQKSNSGAIPDIVIWPETAYPFTVSLGKDYPVPELGMLLTGAVRAEGTRPDIAVWNSFMVFNGDGKILASYDKHQLVPFGEFVPLRGLLPLDKITPGDVDFSRGKGPQTITVKGIPPFSPLICYEVIFPWMSVDFVQRPEWILNVTNDGWYGDSPGPYQHLAAAQMRAIEQGLPVIRAANSGISAIIDGKGRILSKLAYGKQGLIDFWLPKVDFIALYASVSGITLQSVVLLFSIFLLFYRKRFSKNK